MNCRSYCTHRAPAFFMKSYKTILALFCYCSCIVSFVHAEHHFNSHISFHSDTIKPIINRQTDSIIQHVIVNNTQPEKKEVAVIHDLTQYGFRDLFVAFEYDPNLPYSSQVNPNAEVFMNGYMQKHEKQLLSLKHNGNYYFNLIDNIFKQYGLPVELKYLAVIESGLKTSATSWVGAAGPWQFMPATAKEYGLIVNKQVDERRDYYKSTYAAARLLLKLYQQYKDWMLVIAAYNGGGGRVNQAIRKAGSTNFWKLQHYLPEESKNHVKKFIATHYVMENKSFQSNSVRLNNNSDPSLAFSDSLHLTGKFIASVIAQQLNMDQATFDRLNPNFDQELQQKGIYALRLSEEKMLQFKRDRKQILEACIQAHIHGTY